MNAYYIFLCGVMWGRSVQAGGELLRVEGFLDPGAGELAWASDPEERATIDTHSFRNKGRSRDN